MAESVRVLLSETIDYAGHLPPASWSVSKSLRNYVKDVKSPEGWLVGRFVCPAKQLASLRFRVGKLRRARPRRLATSSEAVKLRRMLSETLGVDADRYFDPLAYLDRLGADSLDVVELIMEMEEEFDLGISGHDIRTALLQELASSISSETAHLLSIVCDRATDERSFRAQLQRDLKAMSALQRACSSAARIDSVELALSNDLLDGSQASLTSLLVEIGADAAALSLRVVFLQVPQDRTWQRSLNRLLASLADCPQAAIGLKLGCSPAGSLTLDQIAFFLDVARRENLPWKWTSENTPPLSQAAEQSATAQVGFLNLLTAGALNSVHALAHEELVSLLGDSSLREFRFGDDGLSWNGIRATLDELEQWRSRNGAYLDRCGLDETITGLRDLILIA